jgi:hypothetical protein
MKNGEKIIATDLTHGEFYREVSQHFEQVFAVELSWRHASRKEVWDMQRAGACARDCAIEIGKRHGLKVKE